MLTLFRVYLKNGEIFRLKFRRFEYNEETFVIYDSTDKVVSGAYLFSKHIAAVIPEEQTEGGEIFKVYLLNGHTFEIHAHYFSPEEPSFRFFRESETEKPDEEIKDVYVASSVVAAILPREVVDRE